MDQQRISRETQVQTQMFGHKLDIFSAPDERPGKRTPQEMAELKGRIGLIARVFSQTYHLGVYPSPQGGWCCSIDEDHLETISSYLRGEIDSLDSLPKDALKPKKIYYDVADIEGAMSDDEIIGVTRHEIGHVNHSDFRLLVEGQRIAIDEGYLPTSWMSIANALEDPRVNNLEIGGSDVVREKMTKLYRKWVAETQEKIGTQPVTHQLGLALIHYWLTEELMKGITDQKVIDAFHDIKPFADQYFASDDSQEAHELLKNEIWPRYKTLEQKALTDEQMKEFMRRVGGSSFGDSKQLERGSPEGAISGIVDKIKKAFGIKPDKKNDHIADGADPDLKKQLHDEMRKQEESAANRDAKLESQKSATGSIPDDISLDNLPDDLKKALEDAVKNLPNDLKKELEKAAREQLDKKQADAANTKNPKIIQMEKDEKTGTYLPKVKAPDKENARKLEQQVDTYNELEKSQEDIRSSARAQAEIQKKAKEEEERRRNAEIAEMQKQGFDEQDTELFREFKRMEASMEGYISSFMKLLDRYLPKQEESVHSGEFYSGKKLNKKAVVKHAPFNDNRFFMRREIVESPEPKMFVTLLIDRTGSMRGQKMYESLKTAVFFARVLTRFGIPFAIKFFGEKVKSIKTFPQDYDKPEHGIKKKLVKEGVANDGSTDIATPMIETIEDMSKARRTYAGCHGGIFVISDSGANTGSMTGEKLGEYIQEHQKRYTIINLLLSASEQDMEEAKKLFGEKSVVQAKEFTELPKVAFTVLRILLERVLKTYRNIT